MGFHWNLDKDFGWESARDSAWDHISKKCERHDLRGCRGCPALNKACKGAKSK